MFSVEFDFCQQCLKVDSTSSFEQCSAEASNGHVPSAVHTSVLVGRQEYSPVWPILVSHIPAGQEVTI
jgi:hypothetical protein